jgi:hypothetical protein
MAPLSPLERVVQFVQKLFVVPAAIWNSLATGTLGAPLRWIGRLFGWYKRRIWDRTTRNAAGVQTGKRIGFTLAGTALGLYILPTVIVSVFSAVLLLTTMRTEEVFLNSSEEIDPAGDVHNIKGCTAIRCSEQNSVYYHVRPDFVHDVYAWTKGRWAFYPDNVAAVVAPGVNSCTVTSYGFRMRLLRGWGIYPDILDATCEPYMAPNGLPAGVVPTP